MHSAGFIKRHPSWAYFALVFIFSWTWWGSLFVIAPGGLPGGRAQFGAPALFALLAALGPSLVGIVLTCVVGGKEGLSFVPSQSPMDYIRVHSVFAAVLWLVVAIVVATSGAKRLVREPRHQT